MRNTTKEPTMTETTDTRLSEAIHEMVRDIKRTERDIRSLAASIRQDLDRVEDGLNENLALNGLGELQTSGPRFDQMIARRSQLYEELSRLEYIAEGS